MLLKLLHQKNPDIQFHARTTLDFALHLHDVLELVFVHAGTATAICSGKRYDLQPGDVFVSFPNQPHGYENSRETDCDVLIMPTNPYLAPWRGLMSQKIPETPVLCRDRWQHTGVKTLLEMVRLERKPISLPVLQGYAMVIVGKMLPCLTLIPQPDGGSDTLHRLLLYINEHYREPLSRSDIARAVGYNESYISHIFAENLNTNLTDYITSLRLRDAKLLLTETDMTVSQICLTLGFGSIRSFNRSFARAFSMSPTEYRKQAGID